MNASLLHFHKEKLPGKQKLSAPFPYSYHQFYTNPNYPLMMTFYCLLPTVYRLLLNLSVVE